MVWCNLRRKKLRTSLTLLSVLVAFVLFAILCALKMALAGGVNLADANRLIVRHRVSFIQPLPQSYKARIARVPGVSLVSHQTWFGGIYQDPKNQFGSFPVDPGAIPANESTDQPASPRRRRLGSRPEPGQSLADNLAERFHWKIGDRVPLTAPIWRSKDGGAWEFDIVGIYDGHKKGG